MPLIFRDLSKVTSTLPSPVLGFQFTNGIVLLASKLAGHLNGVGDAIEGADFIGEFCATGFTLAGDSQVRGFRSINLKLVCERRRIPFYAF